MKNLIDCESISCWKTFYASVVWLCSLLYSIPNACFSASREDLHFAERPNTIPKGRWTVKGTVISRVNLSFVITRNGFCAETKPTIHFTEPVFIGKTPFPQEAERPFFCRFAYSALRGTTNVCLKYSLCKMRNDH